MGRINLYVADALEQRMSRFRDQLNWSAIAQEAFEQAVKLEELKGEGSMEAAQIERLRHSRAKHEQSQHSIGFKIGRTWALDEAEYDALERVTSVDIEVPGIDAVEEKRSAAARLLATAYLGEDAIASYRETTEAMERLFDERSPSAEKIQGFIDGATEVYAEV